MLEDAPPPNNGAKPAGISMTNVRYTFRKVIKDFEYFCTDQMAPWELYFMLPHVVIGQDHHIYILISSASCLVMLYMWHN